MNILPLLFSLIVFVILLLGLVGIFTTRVPFVSVPEEVLPEILKALKIQKKSIVYDLGCGDGRVLLKAWETEPEATFVGLEKNLIPFALARVRKIFLKKKNSIRIVCADFFKQNLSEATHIFTYLYPEVMNDLLPKLEKELAPGTRLVSCDYQFSYKKPVEIIDLNRPVKSLGRTLFIYEF